MDQPSPLDSFLGAGVADNPLTEQDHRADRQLTGREPFLGDRDGRPDQLLQTHRSTR